MRKKIKKMISHRHHLGAYHARYNYMVSRPSVVCRLPVCNVRALYSGD